MAAAKAAPRGGAIRVCPWAFRPRGRTSAPANSSCRAGTRRSRRIEEQLMPRSVWKGPFVDGYMLKKADAARASGRSEVIKIWSRRSTILPQFVGLTFGVYNGQKHIPVYVTEDMVGHKFGEFSPTRIFQSHSAVAERTAKKETAAPPRASPGAAAPAAAAAPSKAS